jgi:hypothetical protein
VDAEELEVAGILSDLSRLIRSWDRLERQRERRERRRPLSVQRDSNPSPEPAPAAASSAVPSPDTHYSKRRNVRRPKPSDIRNKPSEIDYFRR